MPVQGNIEDVRKGFNFAVEVDGLLAGYAQKVKIPKISQNRIEHADASGFTVQTGGRPKFDDVVITKLVPGENSDTWAYDWFAEGFDPATGQGCPESEIKRDIRIVEFGSDRQKIVGEWLCRRCRIFEIERADLDKNTDENILETITLAPMSVIQIK